MAGTVQVRTSVQVQNGTQFYQSQPTAFTATMSGVKGPTPGSISVSLAGTIVDLSQLQVPGGICRLMNTSATGYVEYGPYDADTHTFYPLGELLPGETYPLRLSRFLGREVGGTGTGTGTGTGGSEVKLMLRAVVNPAVCLVEAFDA